MKINMKEMSNISKMMMKLNKKRSHLKLNILLLKKSTPNNINLPEVEVEDRDKPIKEKKR